MPAEPVTLLCKPIDDPFECSQKYIWKNLSGFTWRKRYCRPVTQHQKNVKENSKSYSTSVLIVLSRQYKDRVHISTDIICDLCPLEQWHYYVNHLIILLNAVTKYICTNEKHYCRPVTQQIFFKENLNSYSTSVLIILSRQYKGRVKQTHPWTPQKTSFWKNKAMSASASPNSERPSIHKNNYLKQKCEYSTLCTDENLIYL